MSLLIRNGRVVTATDDYHADIYVQDDTISLIGDKLDMQADRVIDAAGKLVMPGGVDPHTHMDMPFGGATSADDFESGTRAAAFGGTTTIIDFAIQPKGEAKLPLDRRRGGHGDVGGQRGKGSPSALQATVPHGGVQAGLRLGKAWVRQILNADAGGAHLRSAHQGVNDQAQLLLHAGQGAGAKRPLQHPASQGQEPDQNQGGDRHQARLDTGPP